VASPQYLQTHGHPITASTKRLSTRCVKGPCPHNINSARLHPIHLQPDTLGTSCQAVRTYSFYRSCYYLQPLLRTVLSTCTLHLLQRQNLPSTADAILSVPSLVLLTDSDWARLAQSIFCPDSPGRLAEDGSFEAVKPYSSSVQDLLHAHIPRIRSSLAAALSLNHAANL
jgi:hypothetical protein